MITVKQFMETVDYRVTEGSDYGWSCFGSNVYCISSWNGDYDGWSFNIVFDTQTQRVYSVEACDYKRQRAYRLMDPELKTAHDLEAEQRGSNAREAWDDVDYVDLETDEDWLQKAQAIVSGEDYDTRVILPLDLPDDVLFELMRQAHDRDITLNQHMELILRAEIDRVLEDQDLRDDYDFSEADSGAVAERSKPKMKKSR